eukprot:1196383-Prorocentrum_minimum.AAC.5
MVNLVNGDAPALARDFVALDFLPHNSDARAVVADLAPHLMRTTRAVRSGEAGAMDFQTVVGGLSAALHRHRFRVPASFVSIIRALAALEGSATALDPSFQARLDTRQ